MPIQIILSASLANAERVFKYYIDPDNPINNGWYLYELDEVASNSYTRNNDRSITTDNSDIYIFNRQDGHVTISDEGSLSDAGDVILFGEDISVNDIMLRRDGADMFIYIRDEDDPDTPMAELSNSIRIENWGHQTNRVETLQFADGSLLDISQVNSTITESAILGDLSEDASNNPDEIATKGVWHNHASDTVNMTGSAGNDILFGNNLDNTLHGNGGNDTLYASKGADTLDGGEGSETVSYEMSDAAVTINLLSRKALGGHAEGDSLTNIENITGSAFDDELTGDSGNNILIGGDGNDLLRGNDGNNVLHGGDGRDTFHFSKISFFDIIKDFTDDDKMQFYKFKAEEVRIASGHGHNIKEGNYGDSAVEDAIIYDTKGTADLLDDLALVVLSDYNADDLTMNESGNYLVIV